MSLHSASAWTWKQLDSQLGGGPSYGSTLTLAVASGKPRAVLIGGCRLGTAISGDGVMTGSAPRVEVASLPRADAGHFQDVSWQDLAWGQVRPPGLRWRRPQAMLHMCIDLVL